MNDNQPIGVIGQVSNRVWCRFAGPGRGDCAHFIGLPAVFDQATTDEYGIPHGWCEYCWSSHQRDELHLRCHELMSALKFAHDEMCSWYSSEYANHTSSQFISEEIAKGVAVSSTEPPALLKEVEHLKDNIEQLSTSRGKWMSRAEAAEKEVDRLRAERDQTHAQAIIIKALAQLTDGKEQS